MRRLLLALGGFALCASAVATTGPWVDNHQARVRLVSGRAAAPAGDDPELGLEFALVPGWHVYWKNAGDAGYPPAIELPEAGALAAATLRYPAPERFELPGELVAFGYEDEVVYPIDARLREDLPDGPAQIRVHLDYLVCAESCIPYEVDLTLPFASGTAVPDGATAPRLAAWRARLPLEAGSAGAPREESRLKSASTEGGMELLVELSGGGLRAVSPDLFFEPSRSVSFGRPRFVASVAGPGFRVPVEPLDRTRPLPDPLPVAWTATGFESATGAALAVESSVALALPKIPADSAFEPGLVRRALLAGAALAMIAFLLVRFVRAGRRRGGGSSDVSTSG